MRGQVTSHHEGRKIVYRAELIYLSLERAIPDSQRMSRASVRRKSTTKKPSMCLKDRTVTTETHKKKPVDINRLSMLAAKIHDMYPLNFPPGSIRRNM